MLAGDIIKNARGLTCGTPDVISAGDIIKNARGITCGTPDVISAGDIIENARGWSNMLLYANASLLPKARMYSF